MTSLNFIIKTLLPVIISAFIGYYFNVLRERNKSFTTLFKLTEIDQRRQIYISLCLFFEAFLVTLIILFYLKKYNELFGYSLLITILIAILHIIIYKNKGIGVRHFPYFEKDGIQLYVLKELGNDRVLVCRSDKIDMKNDLYPREIEIVKIKDFETKPLKYGTLKSIIKK